MRDIMGETMGGESEVVEFVVIFDGEMIIEDDDEVSISEGEIDGNGPRE
jgi:hypothetical protein